MAIQLKTDKTFNPTISQSYGVDMTGSNYYGVIDDIQYSKKEKACFFSLEIYGNKESRNDSGLVVERINFNFVGDEFDLHVGNTGLTVVQAYNIALNTLEDWKSDE